MELPKVPWANKLGGCAWTGAKEQEVTCSIHIPKPVSKCKDHFFWYQAITSVPWLVFLSFFLGRVLILSKMGRCDRLGCPRMRQRSCQRCKSEALRLSEVVQRTESIHKLFQQMIDIYTTHIKKKRSKLMYILHVQCTSKYSRTRRCRKFQKKYIDNIIHKNMCL